MKKPLEKECPNSECDKIIYGFSKKDLEYRMLMHSNTHRKKEKEKENEII